MLAFQVRGWELVAANVSDPLIRSLQPLAQRVIRLGDGRYTIELPLDPPPDRVMAEIVAAGAAVISLNPIRDTLEDFFVQQVTMPEVQARDRGLGQHA
jgi:hypothetical protein